jgi:hypothetical protein
MVAAHEQLNRLSEEIKAGIQAQLTDAINQVHTKGGEYIERTTGERLALLRTDAVEEMDKRIQLAFVGRPQLEADTTNLQQQVALLRDDVPHQIESSEKRVHDGAVAAASSHAERIVARAEGKLAEQIELRLAAAEETVSSALKRAETHCNVIEKRARESTDRAVNDLRTVWTSTNALSTSDLQRQIGLFRDEFLRQLQALETRSQEQSTAQMTTLIDSHRANMERRMATRIETRLTALEHRLDAVPQSATDGQSSRVDVREDDVYVARLIARAETELVSKLEQQIAALEAQARIAGSVSRETASTANGLAHSNRTEERVRDLIDSRLGDLERRVVAAASRAEIACAESDKLAKDFVIEQLRSSARFEEHRSSTGGPNRCAEIPQRMQEAIRQQLEDLMRKRINEIVTDAMNRQFELVIRPRLDVLTAQLFTQQTTSLERVVRDTVANELRLPCSMPWPGAQASIPSRVASSNCRSVSRSGPPPSSNEDELETDFSPPTRFNPRKLLESREQAKANRQQCQHLSAKQPAMLESMRSGEVRRFVQEYGEYRSNAGGKEWTAYVAPAVLQYLRRVECGENASDEQVFQHLTTKATIGANDIKLIDQKFQEIKIDSMADSSVEKVQSLLLGVERVLIDIGSGGKDTVPLATQQAIVLENLPQELRARVERRMKYAPPIASKKQFAELLVEEATSFEWPRDRLVHFK